MTGPLRIGILGAARIAGASIVGPAQRSADVELVAVAARDRHKAAQFAARAGIPRLHASYEDLLADDDIEAVYIPLPNALHAPWTIRALEAGKHVLVEKPFSNNADEAAHVASVASAHPDLVCMEAYHYRYHPLFPEIERSLTHIGQITDVEASFTLDLEDMGDIRWSYELGGGTTMDLGCYPLHLLRSLFDAEPVVLAATSVPSPEDDRVDATLTAKLLLGEVTATVTSSMKSDRAEDWVVFTGEEGRLRVDGFVKPHEGHDLVVTTAAGTETTRLPLHPTTYDHQLAAFVHAVRTGAPVLTGPEDSLATMRVIDAMYELAGLPVRGA